MQTIAWSLQGYAPSFNAMLAVPNDDCSQSINEIMNQMLSPEAGSNDSSSTKTENDQSASNPSLSAVITGQQGDSSDVAPLLMELLRGMNENKRQFFTVTQSLERIEGQGARIENCFIRQFAPQDSSSNTPITPTTSNDNLNATNHTTTGSESISKREAEQALLNLRSYILFKMRIKFPDFEPYHCVAQRTAILQALHAKSTSIEEYISVPVIKRIISMNDKGRELIDQQLEDWGDQIAAILASVDYNKVSDDLDQNEIA